MTEEKTEQEKEAEVSEALKEQDKTRCSKCLSSQTYIKKKTNERICRKCAHTEKL